MSTARIAITMPKAMAVVTSGVIWFVIAGLVYFFDVEGCKWNCIQLIGDGYS